MERRWKPPQCRDVRAYAERTWEADPTDGEVEDAVGQCDNIVIAGDLAEPAGALLSVAFNVNGVNNTVNAFGPLSIAGALIVSDQEPITKDGPGITVRTPLNPNPAGGSVLAARGTQGSLVRPSPKFSPAVNAGSNVRKATSQGGSALKSVSDRVTTSAKKFSDTVSKVTRGVAGGSKAAAAKTSSGDK